LLLFLFYETHACIDPAHRIARIRATIYSLTTMPHDETWTIRKPAVESNGGIVTAQHYMAARAGADVLARGANAIDAAITTAFALAAVEPWMSGLGGCGCMLVYLASEKRTFALEFGVRAPLALDPADYPLSGGYDSDLFAWPGVLENRNVLGPKSVAVPGFVAGMAEAASRFASFNWNDLLSPAVELAEAGLRVDWYSSLKIASSARDIDRFASTRSIYLPGGFVPVGEWSGPAPVIQLSGLSNTLRRLASEGPASFYSGPLAADLLTDARSVGIDILADDLAAYCPQCTEISGFGYRDAKVFSPPGLCAGPTLQEALTSLQSLISASSATPDADTYLHYANSMETAYEHRLQAVGDSPDGKLPSCTTHLNVIDRQGNMVALTQTLLSLFGSKVVLPETGILMNNGIMWFDPRPGRANSIAPGKQPLSNMCPAIVQESDGSRFTLGASGGRRIMSAVLQLISFLVDFSMDPESAMHQPRIDVSGTRKVDFDTQIEPEIANQLLKRLDHARPTSHGVFPSLFACPGLARFDAKTGRVTGASFVYSPLAAAIAEDRID
jgi:gamma-glutamyltranspeptidase/glutathione hydrolase